MFHIVDENNPKRVIQIGDKWISYCYMCENCYNYLKTKHPWALDLKWKTFDNVNENVELISAITDNPIPSFGKVKQRLFNKKPTKK